MLLWILSSEIWDLHSRLVIHAFYYVNTEGDFFYSWNNSGECVGYSDADWAGDINDRKSTSAYVLQINGAPVMWRSKKQVYV